MTHIRTTAAPARPSTASCGRPNPSGRQVLHELRQASKSRASARTPTSSFTGLRARSVTDPSRGSTRTDQRLGDFTRRFAPRPLPTTSGSRLEAFTEATFPAEVSTPLIRADCAASGRPSFGAGAQPTLYSDRSRVRVLPRSFASTRAARERVATLAERLAERPPLAEGEGEPHPKLVRGVGRDRLRTVPRGAAFLRVGGPRCCHSRPSTAPRSSRSVLRRRHGEPPRSYAAARANAPPERRRHFAIGRTPSERGSREGLLDHEVSLRHGRAVYGETEGAQPAAIQLGHQDWRTAIARCGKTTHATRVGVPLLDGASRPAVGSRAFDRPYARTSSSRRCLVPRRRIRTRVRRLPARPIVPEDASGDGFDARRREDRRERSKAIRARIAVIACQELPVTTCSSPSARSAVARRKSIPLEPHVEGLGSLRGGAHDEPGYSIAARAAPSSQGLLWRAARVTVDVVWHRRMKFDDAVGSWSSGRASAAERGREVAATRSRREPSSLCVGRRDLALPTRRARGWGCGFSTTAFWRRLASPAPARKGARA